MNTQLTSELAVRHIHDLRHAAAQRRRNLDLTADRCAALDASIDRGQSHNFLEILRDLLRTWSLWRY
jgi:hypothetical protein